MNNFQITTIVCLAAALCALVVQFSRGKLSFWMFANSAMVCVLTATAIARPDWVQRFAGLLGIGRGADVVLYLLVFAFLATSFFFYSRWLALRKDVTELARRHAIDNAARGDGTGEVDGGVN